MNTESTSPLSSSSLSLPSPSATRLDAELPPPTPIRGMTPTEDVAHVIGKDVIAHTERPSGGESLPRSSNVTEANRGTSSVWGTLGSLLKRAFGGTSSSSALESATETTTASTRHSLVRSESSTPPESSLMRASAEHEPEALIELEAEGEAPTTAAIDADTTTATTAATDADTTTATTAATDADTTTATTAATDTDTTTATTAATDADTTTATTAATDTDTTTATTAATTATSTTTPAPPSAGTGAPPEGTGEAPRTAPAVPTLIVVRGTTTFAEIQAHATELNRLGTMPGSLLHQVKRHMQEMYGDGNATISSRMARDASGKYDLDTWDNRGTRCYKMDVTFVVTNYDAGTPPTARGEVEVTKTIYTNAVDPKQALQIIDAIKNGVVDSANGADAALQGESTFLLNFDKDKKGQFTELKSIKGQTTHIDLPLPTLKTPDYTYKGKRVKAGERYEGRVTYQSKLEMIQRGASYAIRGTGGRDVVMGRIATNNLTVDTFVKDIEKKEKELEETKKKSFMRFNGIFGNWESSDVGTFKAYSEAYDAVRGATGQVALTPEWRAIPKVKAYVDAHNAVVTKKEQRATQLAAAGRNIEALRGQVDTLNAQRIAARQAVTNHQQIYDEAMRAEEDAARDLSAAQRDLDQIPVSHVIGEETPGRTAAWNLVQARRDRLHNAHSNFGRVDTEHTRLRNEVINLEGEARARNAEHRRALTDLGSLQARLDGQVASAEGKLRKIQAKFDNLSEKMSVQLAEFRREYDELTELKRTVDGMVANPVTSGTNTLSAEDLQKLQETQARLAAIETNNRELLEHLGLRGTAPLPPPPIMATFNPPPAP